MVERSDVAAQATTENPAPEPVRYARTLGPGQRAELHILDVETGTSQLLLSSTDVLFEAPNWHPEGRRIVVNGDGVLYRVDVDAPAGLQEVTASGLPELNNDHLIASDGRWHYVSANDGHLYRLPWEGGEAERVTTVKAPDRVFRHFLHGVSPDGRTLVYVGTEILDRDEWGRRALWLLDLDSGAERLVGDGYSPADGPDFSPDGHSVYFNSEVASNVEGHAQLFRHDRRVRGAAHVGRARQLVPPPVTRRTSACVSQLPARHGRPPGRPRRRAAHGRPSRRSSAHAGRAPRGTGHDQRPQLGTRRTATGVRLLSLRGVLTRHHSPGRPARRGRAGRQRGQESPTV